MERNPAPAQSLVTFKLDHQTFALPIEPIERIVEMVAVTPIPQAHRSILGVINVRGTVVPVVHLGRHLGLPETDVRLDTHVILVGVGGRSIGLVVDQVMDVLNLTSSQIIAPADILPDGLGDAPLLRGLVQTQAGTLMLLNLDYLFRPDHTLSQAITALPALADKETNAGAGQAPETATFPMESALETKA